MSRDGRSPGALLKLILDRWLGAEAETKSGPDGAFEFPAVRPGDWRIQAEGKRDGIAIQGALAGTITRRDVEDQQVRLYPPFTMAGFVDREEPRDSKGERKVTGVFLEGTDEVLQAHAFHNQDGSFTIKDVYPGRYRIVPMGFVPGYYVDSVMLGERDVMNQEVDLAPGAPPMRVNYRPKAGKVRGIGGELRRGSRSTSCRRTRLFSTTSSSARARAIPMAASKSTACARAATTPSLSIVWTPRRWRMRLSSAAWRRAPRRFR